MNPRAKRAKSQTGTPTPAGVSKRSRARGWWSRRAAGLAALWIGAAPAWGVEPVVPASGTAANADSAVVQAIRSTVAAARHPGLRWSDFPYYADEMQGLYGPLGYGPVWLLAGKPRPQAREVVDELLAAANRGLDPADYDATQLDATLRALQGGQPPGAREQGLFDAALSIGFLRFISDLHIGRINPRKLGVAFDVGPKKYDLPPLVRRAIDANRIRQTVAEAEPKLALYRRMQVALQQYRQLARDPALGPLPAGTTVRPGEAFAGLTALAHRLAAFGDLAAASPAPAAGGVYAGDVVEAVKRFQARHGLAPDGVLGKGTIMALNVPVAQRVEQIEFALERLRWLPDLDGGPFLVVNIPAFQVWGFDSLNAAGPPPLHMRVVVGKALNTRTPVFEEDMQYVVFRPYWNVPYSIVKGELLPALRQNSNALAVRNMELVRGFDDATALPVTAENIAGLAKGTLRVRQVPGPKNALGLAKFIFPNADNVYMHGTPAQALFERSRRDFSHGCIRLEEPLAMAEFVLRDQPEWTRARIEAAMNGAKPTHVNLKRRLPAIIFYTTAIVDLADKVHFYEDIYGHDTKLKKELLAGYPYQP